MHTTLFEVPLEAGKSRSSTLGKGDMMPHPLVRPAMLQTALSVLPPMSAGCVTDNEWPVLLDGGPDETGYDKRVRLLAYYSPRRTMGLGRGLVISLHGWEGCSHSVYNLVLAEALTEAGYDVLRLNVRDHGPGVHVDPYRLNRGLFLGTLVREVAYASCQGALLADGGPVWLTGPSMGGNFVLRVAALQGELPIPNLQRVVAINPAVDPADATDRADANPMIHYYFRRRWGRSLAAKQACFPGLYDFGDVLKLHSIRAMTDVLVRRYSVYGSADCYFEAYAVGENLLAHVCVPISILSAADDPLIDAHRFERMAFDECIRLKILPYGGHVGYMDLWPLHHCLPQLVLAELDGGQGSF